MVPGLNRDELAGSIESALARAGFELIDLKLVPRGGSLSVQIFIDHEDGLAAVTLGDCTRASRAIQDGVDLDRLLTGRFSLEVSSPGVDRPLKRPVHYRRFRGETAVVKLARERGGQQIRGTIGDSDEESVTLETEGGPSQCIPYSEIASAHLKRDPWKGKAREQTDDDER